MASDKSLMSAVIGFFGGMLLAGSVTPAGATPIPESVSIPTYIIGIGLERVAPAPTLY